MSTAASSMEQAFRLAQTLSPDERLQLISRLWESIRLSGDFRPSDADLCEMQRRSAELDAGTVKGIPWEVVRDSVRARLASNE
jgi:putative addiction module component (TIGR02574 family)